MTRDLPTDMKQDIATPNTGGTWMWLCQIVIPNYSAERYARNTEEVEYGGQIFDPFNIEVGEQPLIADGSIPRVTLRIRQDVNKVMETIINATQGGLGGVVKLIKVNSKFLDVAIPALEADYDLLVSGSDSDWVTFTLGIPNPLTQRVPLRLYSSSQCPEATPTLFKGPKCLYAGADTTCGGTLKNCRDKGNGEHWGGEIGLDPNVTRL